MSEDLQNESELSHWGEGSCAWGNTQSFPTPREHSVLHTRPDTLVAEAGRIQGSLGGQQETVWTEGALAPQHDRLSIRASL